MAVRTATPAPNLQALMADEESPPSAARSDATNSWLDEPLFDADGNVPPPDDSFWERLWPSPSRLAPVSPLHNNKSNKTEVASEVWNRFIGRVYKWLLVLVLLCLWPVGGYSFVKFTHSTDSTFHPIPGTPSAQAQDAFMRAYPHDWNDPMHPILLLVLDSTNNNTSLVDTTSPSYLQTKTFVEGLQEELLNATCWKTRSDVNCTAGDDWLKLTSYNSLEKEQLSWLAQSLTADNGQTTLVTIQYWLPPNVTHSRERVRQLMTVIQDYGDAHVPTDYFTLSYTGIKWFQSDLQQATQSDLRHMDALVLPFALFLVGIVLPHAHAGFVWIIPLVTLISTVCLWSIVMALCVDHLQVTHFTPSIMMSLTLGMGIDYTLFLLSRFAEFPLSPQPTAIGHMIQHGGHVVLLSGLTLMFTFLGLCFLPLQMISSVGIGAAVAIACALLVNLTVVPALLYTRLGRKIIQRQQETVESTQQEQDDLDPLANIGQPLSESPAPPQEANHNEPAPIPKTSIWYRLSTHLLHPYKSVIILLVVIQLLVPIASFAFQIKSSISIDLLLPSTSPSFQTFDELGKKMGYGRLAPYRILFDGRNGKLKMNSNAGFDVMHRVLDELVAIDHEGEINGITHIATGQEDVQPMVDALMDNLGMSEPAMQRKLEQDCPTCHQDEVIISARKRTTMYAGIAMLKNERIPHSLYISSKLCSQMKPHCPIQLMHLIDVVDETATSEDQYSTYVTATLAVNPFSEDGLEWLRKARATLQRLENGGALGDCQVYIQGGAAIAHDATAAVSRAFPSVICVTMLVVFVVMGVFFKSIVTPLRSIVSISMTLAFVFGLGVLVFQHGVLNWTGVSSWMSIGDDELSWLVPIMSFSIIVGLALDYDVFLVSRILEYRMEGGYSHESSIVAGLHSTGGIITAAGIIMATAFGGLMLSSSPVLYQWSFLMVVAVLFDTFVIRTMVVPIVMGWTGRWSWWPRDLPEPKVHLEGFRDDDENENQPTVQVAREVDSYRPLLHTPRTP